MAWSGGWARAAAAGRPGRRRVTRVVTWAGALGGAGRGALIWPWGRMGRKARGAGQRPRAPLPTLSN
jgi:hypothetical protein